MLSDETLRLADDAVQAVEERHQAGDASVLELNTARIEAGRARREVVVGTREDAGRVTLEVRDTGKGIRTEHLLRIFEPFFTTKDVWSNIGLGLSVTWGIVERHGGTIRVRSEPGRGSCFRVELPVRMPEPPAA